MDEKGITIGFKEIFDQMTGVSKSLQKLEQEFEHIKSTIYLAPQADERSKQNKAAIQNMQKDIEEVKDDFDEYIKRCEKQEEKQKKDRQFFIATVLGFVYFVGKLYWGV